MQGRYWVADYPAFRVASSDELYRLDLGRPPADQHDDTDPGTVRYDTIGYEMLF